MRGLGEVARHAGGAPGSRRGFTLIEVLAAITILASIVLIMTNLFHQCTVAWDSGMRKARMSTEGRGVVDAIVRELSQAAVDDVLRCDIRDGSSTVGFYTFRAEGESGTNRSLRYVQYTWGGGTIWRVVSEVSPHDPYPRLPSPSQPGVVARGVDRLVFNVSPAGASYSTSAPPWVAVTVEMSKAHTNFNVRVGSAGPDGDWDNTDDNIWSDQ